MSASTEAGQGKRPRGAQTECQLVVGIGASAGGMETLQQLLPLAPAASGIAYVVVQHLAPDHESLLAHFLGRRTVMPVLPARQGLAPRPDHVYVISPATVLGLVDGVFQVTRAEPGQRGQVDAFLRTLAIDRCERAVGILLSGMGSDGTEGLRAIRERGGLSFAQAPETAKHDGMPRSAVEAGVVDQVLLVDAMPAALLERARAVKEGRGRTAVPVLARRPDPPTAASSQLLRAIDRICEVLRRSTGQDFSRYEHGTVLRRLRQRLEAPDAPSLEQYVRLLRRDEAAARLLARELMLGVTEFFRDPEAFEYVGRRVLPEILAGKGPGDTLRIWVPGCGSGQEAYTIAMLVGERLDALGRHSPPRVRIIATDVDAEAIAQARQGRYSAYAVQHISPGRRRRFFMHDGNVYQVARDVRQMCVFSQHSVVRDLPFLHLDLVCCRNLLASLDAELQGRTVSVLHYALRSGGYLLLGPSESLGQSDLFEAVDNRFRLFRRTELASRPPVLPPPLATPVDLVADPDRSPGEPTVEAAFERLLHKEYSACGAVVRKSGKLVWIADGARRYLQPRAGPERANILQTAHPRLRPTLRAGLAAAARSGRRVVRDGVRVDLDGAARLLRVTVRPLPGAQRRGDLAVILEPLGEAGADHSRQADKPESRTAGGASYRRLERELRDTRADLLTTSEGLHAAQARIGSSSQELAATNAQLVTANERLQSGAEELRLVNDELASVNAELSLKVEELSRANSDLTNLFCSTDIVTLFVDRERRVARFTPAAKALFELIDGDVGRPIRHLASRFREHDLAADVDLVMRTLQPIERQLETLDRAAWYLLRIVPYRTAQDVVAGAVATLADVTPIKRAEAGLRRLGTVVMDSNDAVTVLDLDGRILEWNGGAERAYGYSADEARRMNIEALVPDEDRARIREQLAAIRRGGDVAGGDQRRMARDGRVLDVSLTMTRLVDDTGRPAAVATTERDISEQKRREREREGLLGELRAAHDELRADLAATAGLLRIGSLFLQDGNVAAVLGQVVEAAVAVVGADFGNVQVLDPESGDLRIAAQRGFPRWWVEFWDEAGKGRGACGTALERRERVLVEDVERSPVFSGPHLEAQRKAGVRAVQSTPIVGRTGAPLGVLSTHTRTVGVPAARALARLDLIARQASDILERARAEDAVRASEERFQSPVRRLGERRDETH